MHVEMSYLHYWHRSVIPLQLVINWIWNGHQASKWRLDLDLGYSKLNNWNPKYNFCKIKYRNDFYLSARYFVI